MGSQLWHGSAYAQGGDKICALQLSPASDLGADIWVAAAQQASCFIAGLGRNIVQLELGFARQRELGWISGSWHRQGTRIW
jgi:hypothetical protein